MLLKHIATGIKYKDKGIGSITCNGKVCMFNMTAPLSYPLTSGPCALVSRINKTPPSGINKTTQLRLDQLLAS